MIVHTFDYATGIYTGPLALGAADVDPRSNAWLIPGNATAEQPPRCDDRCAPFWRDGGWVIFELTADIPDDLMDECRQRVDFMRRIKRVTP